MYKTRHRFKILILLIFKIIYLIYIFHSNNKNSYLLYVTLPRLLRRLCLYLYMSGSRVKVQTTDNSNKIKHTFESNTKLKQTIHEAAR